MSQIVLEEQTTPLIPATNQVKIYPKAGGGLWKINDLDEESQIIENNIFDANTILKADTDNTPSTVVVAEQTLIGRLTAGVITALTAAQVRTLLNFVTGAAYTQTYSTADRTVPAATQSTPPAGGTGTTAGAYDTAENRDLMIASITAGAADLLALKKVVNALIDDLQASGLIG